MRSFTNAVTQSECIFTQRQLEFNDLKNCWPFRKPMPANKSNPLITTASIARGKNYFYLRLSSFIASRKKEIFRRKKWFSNVKHKYDLRKIGQQGTQKISSFYWKLFVILRHSNEMKFILFSRWYLFHVEFDSQKNVVNRYIFWCFKRLPLHRIIVR